MLVIAGGGATVAGDYHSSMDVLRSGLLERHGIVRAGVAGHPEGSPDIAPEAILAALAEKNAFAAGSAIELRIVSQFALAAEPYVTWERGAACGGKPAAGGRRHPRRDLAAARCSSSRWPAASAPPWRCSASSRAGC